MTIIKLGRNTYRVYATSVAVSFLFYIKNGTPVLKRTDGNDEWDKVSNGGKYLFLLKAEYEMDLYLQNNAQAWEIQGEVLAALA